MQVSPTRFSGIYLFGVPANAEAERVTVPAHPESNANDTFLYLSDQGKERDLSLYRATPEEHRPALLRRLRQIAYTEYEQREMVR